MYVKVWAPFLLLVILLSSGVYWARSRTSTVSVLELRWTRYVGVQECVEHISDDRFVLGFTREIIKPCRWIWADLRVSSGYNSTPHWPNLDDLDETYRVVLRSEFYEAKLAPKDLPNALWYFASSDSSHYTLFLKTLQNQTESPKVVATFGQVERIVIQ